MQSIVFVPIHAQEKAALDQESVFLKNFYDVKPDPNIVNPHSNELEAMFSESEGYQIVDESGNATAANVDYEITTDLRQDGADEKSQTSRGWFSTILLGLILPLLLIAILWGLYKAWQRFGSGRAKPFSRTVKQTEDFDAVTELQLANFALAAGESAKAQKMFDNIIEHEPSFLEAHKGLLKIQGEAADRNSFDKSYAFATDQYPTDSSNYKQLKSIRDYYFGNISSDKEATQAEKETSDSKSLPDEPGPVTDIDDNLVEEVESTEVVRDESLVSHPDDDNVDDAVSDQESLDVIEESIISEAVTAESTTPEVSEDTEFDNNPKANFDPFVDSIAGKFSYQHDSSDNGETAEVAESPVKSQSAAVVSEGVVDDAAADTTVLYNSTDVQDIGYVNETRLELAEYMLNSGNVIVANVLLKKVFQTGDGEKCIEAQKLIKKYTVDINLS